jgi:hypothetical protein
MMTGRPRWRCASTLMIRSYIQLMPNFAEQEHDVPEFLLLISAILKRTIGSSRVASTLRLARRSEDLYL